MRNAIADIRVRHMCVSTRRGHAVADVAASLTSSPSSATAQRYMVICLVTRSALIASTIYLMNSTNVQPNFASLLPGSDKPPYLKHAPSAFMANYRLAASGHCTHVSPCAYQFILYGVVSCTRTHAHAHKPNAVPLPPTIPLDSVSCAQVCGAMVRPHGRRFVGA